MSDPASTILVVEDDSIVRMLIVDVLEELEYRVLEAADGKAALAFLQDPEAKINLLMTDKGPASEGEHKADLAALGITEVAIELNNSSFDGFVSELQPDVVLFDQFLMEEQFGWRVEKHCPGALRVLETCDLQSLRHARHQMLKEQLKENGSREHFGDVFAAPDATLFQRMATMDLAQRELASFYRSDLNLMVSDVEIDLLTTHFKVPADLLHWCPLMLRDLPDNAIGFSERLPFLCIGNFRHAPNWDAVLWLKNTLWPLIRQQLPSAQLH
nr:glycosyltransferase family 4 protein [Tanacetum cinerariifolium]